MTVKTLYIVLVINTVVSATAMLAAGITLDGVAEGPASPPHVEVEEPGIEAAPCTPYDESWNTSIPVDPCPT